MTGAAMCSGERRRHRAQAAPDERRQRRAWTTPVEKRRQCAQAKGGDDMLERF